MPPLGTGASYGDRPSRSGGRIHGPAMIRAMEDARWPR